ncbi:hypothetical protein A8B75_16715 [Sphingomonadales bacterium EhC05]|nr:hypothetical protein A8B75_16715 [Sphingomonadales bacterium EhC05]
MAKTIAGNFGSSLKPAKKCFQNECSLFRHKTAFEDDWIKPLKSKITHITLQASNAIAPPHVDDLLPVINYKLDHFSSGQQVIQYLFLDNVVSSEIIVRSHQQATEWNLIPGEPLFG